MTDVYARLDKRGRFVLCGALDKRTGAGCGAMLGLIIEDVGKRLVWLPPSWKVEYQPQAAPGEQVWSISSRAMKQHRFGFPPVVRSIMGDGIDSAGSVIGWLPFLPARIHCRCTYTQWLARDRLDAHNTPWDKRVPSACADPSCPRPAGRSGYCAVHAKEGQASPEAARSSPLPAVAGILRAPGDLKRWKRFVQALG